MPCGCRDKSALTPDTRMLVRAYPRPDNEFGVLPTQADLTCTRPYEGIFQQATVFVIGYGQEGERLFKRGDRRAAVDYAKQNKLTFDQVQARSLCHDVALELLGA